MAYEYSQLEKIKDRILTQLETHENNLDTCVAQFTTIKNALTAMQTEYGGAGGWASQVEDYLTANPGDNAALVLKAQKDAIAAEFVSKKSRATSLESAVSGI